MKNYKSGCGLFFGFFLLLWENKQIKRGLFKVLAFNTQRVPLSVGHR